MIARIWALVATAAVLGGGTFVTMLAGPRAVAAQNNNQNYYVAERSTCADAQGKAAGDQTVTTRSSSCAAAHVEHEKLRRAAPNQDFCTAAFTDKHTVKKEWIHAGPCQGQ
jgi:hypothetical protein